MTSPFPENSPRRPRATTIRDNVAQIEARRGPQVSHYEIPLDNGKRYRFEPGNIQTPDSIAVLGHQGGTDGNWLRVPIVDKGADLTDASVSINAGQDDWRVLPAATLTAPRTITLATTNAENGTRLEITRLDVGAPTLQIDNGGAGGGTLITFPGGVRSFAYFYFDGTNWLLRRAGTMAN
jgi:hypothetical protein